MNVCPVLASPFRRTFHHQNVETVGLKCTKSSSATCSAREREVGLGERLVELGVRMLRGGAEREIAERKE